MSSIIIPACNEASVIARCLTSVMSQVANSDEVIVVCNGCIDDTAKVARHAAPTAIVLELDKPSKAAALAVGDARAKTFPRIYMDADVQLEQGAIEALQNAFTSSDVLALSPDVRMVLNNSSWLVKAYYVVWLSLPYCKSGMIGAGVYALSKAGRARFATFPEIIADDGFVRSLFSENERGMCAGSTSIVQAPHDLKNLLKIKTRSRLGRYQLASRFPELMVNETKNFGEAFCSKIFRPWLWPHVLVYLFVNIVSRIRATKRVSEINTYYWEVDHSTRVARK